MAQARTCSARPLAQPRTGEFPYPFARRLVCDPLEGAGDNGGQVAHDAGIVGGPSMARGAVLCRGLVTSFHKGDRFRG